MNIQEINNFDITIAEHKGGSFSTHFMRLALLRCKTQSSTVQGRNSIEQYNL